MTNEKAIMNLESWQIDLPTNSLQFEVFEKAIKALKVESCKKETENEGSMTREQAINYLRSSGMNEQQIDSVVAAFDQTREGDYMMKKVEQIIFHKLLRVMAMGPIIAKSDMEKLAHDAVEEIREEFRKAGVDVWPRWKGGEE